MCARFHPTEEIVVSASLDQTIRIWDISALLKKSPQNQDFEGLSSRLNQSDLFGFNDAILKYAPLEGHDRGVNWVSFHPNLPLIVSGADDRQIKLWRMNENRAWEVDTLRGHFNNVSCVLFHPRQELILSNSEDRTIRVWDMSKSTALNTFRRDGDRFWILDAHPKQNLFAAGHDSGLIVFKLERERPAFVTHQGKKSCTLYYIKDRHLRAYDFDSGKDTPKISVRKTSSNWKPYALSYNPAEKAILVSSEIGESSSLEATYELYHLPNEDVKSNSSSNSEITSKRGIGRCPTWVARNKFAVLDKSNTVLIKNLDNSINKKITPPYPNTDYLFSASAGRLLMRSEEKISLFDLSLKKTLAEIIAPRIKYVVWSPNNALVAMMGKEILIIANKELEHLCTIHETIKIKSGVWNESGNVFIYTTEHHIKYCLPNGDNGIIRTLDIPIYLTGIVGSKVYCLDRECKNRVISIDTTEFIFKLSLMKKDFSTVYKMVAQSNLIGKSIVSYLQKKKFPEIALCFVKDERTRFELAVECGDLEIALDSAIKINEPNLWERLGEEAMRHGNIQIVEKSYQITNNFEKLSFLYLITGKIDKLQRMRKIAEVREQNMARFHNNLYLGDWENLVTVLQDVGQIGMAHLASLTYQLPEKLKQFQELEKQSQGGEGEEEQQENPEAIKFPESYPLLNQQKQRVLLLPPIPILDDLEGDEINWPLLRQQPSQFSMAAQKQGSLMGIHQEELEENESDEDSLDIQLPSSDTKQDFVGLDLGDDKKEEGEEGEGGWPSDSISFEGEEINTNEQSEMGYFVAPTSAPPPTEEWTKSSLASDHACAGSFDTAMKLLNEQAGIVNFEPLKEHFISLYLASRISLPTFANLPPLTCFLRSNQSSSNHPLSILTLDSLISDLKQAYTATTNGKFKEALKIFSNIIHSIPLLVLQSKQQVTEANDLITLSKEYILGIELENARKTTKEAKRQVELAAYFTHINLQPKHLMLSLKSAMKHAYDSKCFLTASIFGKRILQLKPEGELAKKTKQVVQFCDKNPTDAIKLDYDHKNIFVVCGYDHVPIYKGSASVTCSYCHCSFLPKHKGKLCSICNLGEIGTQTKGIKFIRSSKD